jgi:hypothetical protein
LTDLRQRVADVAERGSQPGEQAFSRLRGRDGSRRAGQEPQTQALLECAHRMDDGRPVDAELDGCLREAPLVGHDGEGRKGAEFIAPQGSWAARRFKNHPLGNTRSHEKIAGRVSRCRNIE